VEELGTRVRLRLNIGRSQSVMATSPQVNCQEGRCERGKANGQAVEGRLKLEVELQSRKRGSFLPCQNVKIMIKHPMTIVKQVTLQA
jgi:hypothetical protein